MTTRKTRDLSLLSVLMCVMIMMFTATGCEVNSPEMPSFDTTFVVPMGTELLTVMDAIDSEDYLMIADDGGIGFHMDGDPDTLDLDFELSVDIPGQNIDQGLGNFSLPTPAPMNYGFELGNIWAPAAGASGVTTIVPGFPIDVTSAGQSIPNLTNATLSSGALIVTVTNNLTVPVGANSGPDQLVLRLENAADSALIAQIFFPLIPAGQSSQQLANLAGATLPDQIAVALSGASAGSAGQPVVVNGTDAISIEAAFSGLVVSSATSTVQTQTFDTTFDSALPADYEITRASIATGSMDISLVNQMPIPCTVYLTWDQIRDLSGVPLTRTYDMVADGSIDAVLDFSNHVIQADSDPLTTLTASVNIITPGSGGQLVTMSATDGLSVTLSPATVGFSSVTGIVPSFDVALDPTTETLDLPDEMSGLELVAANLTLTMINTAGIPADLNLSLTGTGSDGSVRTILVNEQVLPAVGRAPTTTTIVLDQTNSEILDFLNNLPENITLGGSIVAGGTGASGTVHSDDFAIVRWDIDAPLEVVVTDATMDSDPELLDVDADLSDKINTHARGAVLRTEILNHLPMAVELRIVAAQDTNLLATSPLLVIGPVSVAAGITDATTHVVNQSVTSTPTITLNAEEARILGLPGLYTRVEAVLPSTNGQPVKVMSTDYLEFRGVVELEVLVDDEL